MSDFRARVMNIQAVEMCKGKSGADRVRNLCYKEGHKSARHAAAEIANEADAAIAAKDAEIARLRDRLDAALSQSSLFGDALHAIINRCEGMANRIARAALAQAAEVPK